MHAMHAAQASTSGRGCHSAAASRPRALPLLLARRPMPLAAPRLQQHASSVRTRAEQQHAHAQQGIADGLEGPSAAAAAAEAAVDAATEAAAADAVDAASAAGAAAGANNGLQAAERNGASASTSGTSGDTAAPKKAGGAGKFALRVLSGVLLGLGGAAVVAVGRLPFLAAALFVAYQSTQEYYGLLAAKGLAAGRPPPPPLTTAATTALCLSISLATYAQLGRTGTVLSVAAFLLLVINVLGSARPKLSTLTSSVFGLFYCGYLPSFWVKLRALDVAGPVVALPALAALLPQVTVGLAATLVAVACVIAADTGAYFVGKNLGRTKLTDISPKKTVEGAVGGLAAAVATALLLWRALGWPAGSAAAAAGYGALAFFSSLFGDLIESVMKRDAGLKDSGDLIPGHGGLLDRFDSYMFTGAVSYFYVVFLLPRLGLL